MSSVAFRDSTNTTGTGQNNVSSKQPEEAKDATAPQVFELDASFDVDGTPFLDDQSSVDNDENATEDSSSLSLEQSLTADDLTTSGIQENGASSVATKGASSSDAEQCVSVFLRVRPFTQAEESRNEKEALKVVSSEGGTTELDVNGETHNYQFTKVMGPESTQEDIYDSVGAPAVEAALKNNKFSFLFTHGVSNSGKSFTVLGNSANQGLLPRIVSNFAENTQENDNIRLTLSVLEVAGKNMKDLIAPESNVVFHDKGKKRVSNFSVGNLTEHQFERMEKANALINSALSRRATASTGMNEASSRSHALFIIKCYSNEYEEEDEQCIGGITLVDMAGAERIDKSCGTSEGTEKKDAQQRTKESGQINGSLFALFECFRELQRCSKSSKNSGTLDARKVNPVFRRQKEPLVKIIQPYLTGQIGKTKSSQVMVLLTAYPGYKDVGEKKSVFRQAQNALGTSMKFSNIPSRISTYRPNKSKSGRLDQSRSKRDRDADDQLVGTNDDDDDDGTAETPQKRRHTNDGVVSAPLSGKKGIYLHILRMKVARQARDAAIRRFSCPTPKSTKKSVSKMKRSTQKEKTPQKANDSTNETPRKLDFSFQQNDETVNNVKAEAAENQGLLSKMILGVKQAMVPPHTCPVLETGCYEESEDAVYLKDASADEKKSMIDRVLNSVRNQFQELSSIQKKKDEELQEAEARIEKFKADNKAKDDDIMAKTSRVSELLERLDNAESERNELHETLSHKQKELDQVTEHFTSRRSDMVKLRTELSRTQAELSNVNCDYEALSNDHEQLKEQAASLEDTLTSFKEQATMEKEDLRSTGERAVVYGSAQLASLKEKLQESESRECELEDKLSSLREENSKLREQLSIAQEDADKSSNLQKQITIQKEEEHANTRSRVIAAKNSHWELCKQMENYKEQRDQAVQQISQLSEEVESSRQEIQNLKSSYEKQSEEAEQQLKSTRDTQKARAADGEEKLRKCVKENAKLRLALCSKADQIRLLHRNVQTTEGSLMELTQTLLDSKYKQVDQGSKTLQLQQQLQESEESKMVTDLEKGQLQRDLEQTSKRVAELETQVESLNNARSKLQTCLETRTESEHYYKEENKQQRVQIEDLHQALQETRSELRATQTELQTYSNSYVSSKNDLEAENKKLKETISSLETELSSTKESLENVETQYAKIFTERKELKEVLGIAQNEVSAVPAVRDGSNTGNNLTYAQTLSSKISKSAQKQCQNNVTPGHTSESLVDTLTTKACAQDGELLAVIRQLKEGREKIVQRVRQLSHYKETLESQVSAEQKKREKVEQGLSKANQELNAFQSRVETEIEPKNQKIKSLESKQKLLRTLVASLVAGLRHKKSWRKTAAVAWANFLGVSRETLCLAFLEGRYERFEKSLADECGNTVAEYFVEIMNSYAADTKDSISTSALSECEAETNNEFSKVGRSGKPV